MTTSKAAAKANKKWQKKLNSLEGAMTKLKRGEDSHVQLSSLPISRTITGAETHAEKVKLIKAEIRDSHWAKLHGDALTANSHVAIEGEKRAAEAKLAAADEKKARRAEAAAAAAVAAAEVEAAKSPLQTPITPIHHMHLRSHAHSPESAQWKLVVPHNPKAAKKTIAAVTKADAPSMRVAKRTEGQQQNGDTNPGESESTRWQNELQRDLWEPLAGSWADDVQQNVDGGPNGLNVSIPSKHANLEVPQKKTRRRKTKKPNKKAKLGVLSALAALAGESESIIEAEAEQEYAQVSGGGKFVFCGDQLKLPIASLYGTLNEQTQLEIEVNRKKQQQQDEQQRASERQHCINQLSHIFPVDAAFVQLTLIGYGCHPRLSLLGLPESIQEQIYRIVLVKDGPVRITPSSHEQPALLRTCQQLRMETLWIFEIENTFAIEVVDSQVQVPKNYTAHWARQVLCKLETNGTPKWEGLKKWLKAYHEDGVPGLCNKDGDRSMPWDICAQAFALVISLRNIFPGMTFEEMEPMLKVWKETVTLQQVAWSWE